MTELTFHGPFHSINGIKNESAKTKNKAGIYIWGFMYSYNNSGPVDFRKVEPNFKPTNMKFIPYYVGLRKDVFQRLKAHQNVRKGDATKYIRLAQDYIREFCCDDFPINDYKHVKSSKHNDDILKFIKQGDSSKIAYYNYKPVLEKIYYGQRIQFTSCDDKNYPITCQRNIDGTLFNDPLHQLVGNGPNEMNNFWFCYAIWSGDVNELEVCEATTFFSLKGKTVSNTLKWKTFEPKVVIDNTETSIFKKLGFSVVPSKDFLEGY